MQVPFERSITSAPLGAAMLIPVITPFSTIIVAFGINSPLRTSSSAPHRITVAAWSDKAQRKNKIRKLLVYRGNIDPCAFFPALDAFFG